MIKYKALFNYRNAKQEISERDVFNISARANYFTGYCVNSDAQKTFRYDGIIGDVSVSNDDQWQTISVEQWRKAMGFDCPIVPKRQPGASRISLQDQIEICFTGFGKSRGDELKAQAIAAGMLVRSNVTLGLHYLCGGWNAGPTKIAAANKIEGCMYIEEVDFVEMIETGALPAR